MKRKFENNTTGEIIFASTSEDKNGNMVATIKLDEFLKHFSLAVNLEQDLVLKPRITKPITRRSYVNYDHDDDENSLIDFTRD